MPFSLPMNRLLEYDPEKWGRGFPSRQSEAFAWILCSSNYKQVLTGDDLMTAAVTIRIQQPISTSRQEIKITRSPRAYRPRAVVSFSSTL